MISPEILRRYPFFGSLDDACLKAIAMLADEVSYEANQSIFEAGQAADGFYFLMTGAIDLYFVADPPNTSNGQRSFYAGHLNPEEPFGISALIEPYRYTATAITSGPCRVLKIEADGLRAWYESDIPAALTLMRHVARTAMSRLHETRVQMVAAQSEG